MVLTGRNIKAEEAFSWGLVDRIVEDHVNEAIEVVKAIAANSPDAVWASREGIFLGLGEKDAFVAGKEWKERYWPLLRGANNTSEGIEAFVEKTKPNWDRYWDKGDKSKL
jgi:enoyl-CoA hydratase/carnithine racemase